MANGWSVGTFTHWSGNWRVEWSGVGSVGWSGVGTLEWSGVGTVEWGGVGTVEWSGNISILVYWSGNQYRTGKRLRIGHGCGITLEQKLAPWRPQAAN